MLAICVHLLLALSRPFSPPLGLDKTEVALALRETVPGVLSKVGEGRVL